MEKSRQNKENESSRQVNGPGLLNVHLEKLYFLNFSYYELKG